MGGPVAKKSARAISTSDVLFSIENIVEELKKRSILISFTKRLIFKIRSINN